MERILSLLFALSLAAAVPHARAVPLFPALRRPAPVAVLLSPPASPLSAAWLAPTLSLQGLTPDPSLRLTDWQSVFDVSALGAFDVPLRDDPAERINILLSARAVDNLTLAPGAQFSFNRVVGERTPERGFQDGLMFDQGRVIRGTGGGICLVATGLYNAALHAGLPIEERHPHSGVVGYAPPGCDAGIVYGQEDLKFRNTTDRSLVIRALPEDSHIAVRLFGRTPERDRAVVVKPLSLSRLAWGVVTKFDPLVLPGQTVIDQKPRAGYDVTLARFWTVQGRVVRREIVTREHRAPRPEIRRVGPAPVLTAVSEPLSLPPVTPPAAPEAGPVAVPKTDAEPGD